MERAMSATYTDSRLPLHPEIAPSVSYLSIIRELCASHASEPARWQIDADADPTETWIRLCHERSQLPEQGWKLHVSASLWSAETVLRRALPVLLEEVVSLKVAASAE